MRGNLLPSGARTCQLARPVTPWLCQLANGERTGAKSPRPTDRTDLEDSAHPTTRPAPRLCNEMPPNGKIAKAGSCLSSPDYRFPELRCKATRRDGCNDKSRA